MTTLAEIVRRYGPAYRIQYREQLLSSQQAALTAIEACRTAALGGQVFTCTDCGTVRYSYHSCRNRHCPTLFERPPRFQHLGSRKTMSCA
jgi:hypothetical protein